jgi:hypothetical protein
LAIIFRRGDKMLESLFLIMACLISGLVGAGVTLVWQNL